MIGGILAGPNGLTRQLLATSQQRLAKTAFSQTSSETKTDRHDSHLISITYWSFLLKTPSEGTP